MIEPELVTVQSQQEPVLGNVIDHQHPSALWQIARYRLLGLRHLNRPCDARSQASNPIPAMFDESITSSTGPSGVRPRRPLGAARGRGGELTEDRRDELG